MIHIVYPGNQVYTGQIVDAAFRRSFGRGQVESVCPAEWQSILDRETAPTVVVAEPLDDWAELIGKTLKKRRAKLVLFGTLPTMVARLLGAGVRPINSEWNAKATCPPAPLHNFSESPLRIAYRRSLGDVASPIPERAFLRFDFADEWNNLGFGAIRADGSPWASRQMVNLPDTATLAEVTCHGEVVSSYAGLWDWEETSLLWFNRPAGPVDSQEWRLVEVFLSHYRYPDLPCSPSLTEIPYGFDAAVTMRLDCDEDVESARPLWEMYHDLGLPFSLAVHTVLLTDSRHHPLLREVVENGGAVLSHTATHLPNWGGSYETALNEATTSAAQLARVLGIQVPYAVSPFHQTPPYARAALADSGYAGCIGGIILKDPDFLMARGGPPPGSPSGFVGHSQQCMLHGDGLQHGGDQIAVFKEAYDIAVRGRSFFGYLDHPFSARYRYGWSGEEARLDIHLRFIDHLRSRERVLFANENDALDFIRYRAATAVTDSGEGFAVVPSRNLSSAWLLGVEYGGRISAVEEAGWRS